MAENQGYEVLARKWRPQQFDEVVGQEHVTTTLKNAIRSGRVAHAYLFVGPRGIGKTTTARILAKALNCVKGPTETPCDKCDSCREIMRGTSLDVLEIDGASNNGVEQVRDLRDNVRYAPARGPYKIYIIDEVHMLTTAAFNALLKTLEEPPPHVKFIFATTEPQKVPATILSRCQRFDLRPISVKDIVGRLRDIADAEGFDVDQDTLLAIARGAQGGLRDAESALDQLVSFRGTKIRENDVMEVFGLVSRRELENLAGAVLAGDVGAAIASVAEFERAGKDLQRVLLELLEHFRNLLVFLNVGGDEIVGLDVLPAQVEVLKKQAEGTDIERLLRVVGILTETEQRLRHALDRKTLLEIALIRCTRAATVVSIDELLERIDKLRAMLERQGAAAEETGSGKDPVVREDEGGYDAGGDAEAGGGRARPGRRARKGAAAPSGSGGGTGDHESERRHLLEEWHKVAEQTGRISPLARSYLLDAKPVKVTDELVVIGFDPEFAANKDKIDFPRNRKALQKVLGEVLGRQVGVEFVVLDAKDTLPGDIKLTPPTSGSSGSGENPLTGRRRMSQREKERWMKNETVQRVLESFEGDVVDIRE